MSDPAIATAARANSAAPGDDTRRQLYESLLADPLFALTAADDSRRVIAVASDESLTDAAVAVFSDAEAAKRAAEGTSHVVDAFSVMEIADAALSRGLPAVAIDPGLPHGLRLDARELRSLRDGRFPLPPSAASARDAAPHEVEVLESPLPEALIDAITSACEDDGAVTAVYLLELERLEGRRRVAIAMDTGDDESMSAFVRRTGSILSALAPEIDLAYVRIEHDELFDVIVAETAPTFVRGPAAVPPGLAGPVTDEEMAVAAAMLAADVDELPAPESLAHGLRRLEARGLVAVDPDDRVRISTSAGALFRTVLHPVGVAWAARGSEAPLDIRLGPAFAVDVRPRTDGLWDLVPVAHADVPAALWARASGEVGDPGRAEPMPRLVLDGAKGDDLLAAIAAGDRRAAEAQAPPALVAAFGTLAREAVHCAVELTAIGPSGSEGELLQWLACESLGLVLVETAPASAHAGGGAIELRSTDADELIALISRALGVILDSGAYADTPVPQR